MDGRGEAVETVGCEAVVVREEEGLGELVEDENS